MAGPLLLIPAAIVGMLIAFVKLHAAHITARAAMAAARKFVETRDADAAADAAIAAGASAMTGDLVMDFFRANF